MSDEPCGAGTQVETRCGRWATDRAPDGSPRCWQHVDSPDYVPPAEGSGVAVVMGGVDLGHFDQVGGALIRRPDSANMVSAGASDPERTGAGHA